MNNSPKISLFTPNSIERSNNSFCKNYSFYSPKNLMFNVNYLASNSNQKFSNIKFFTSTHNQETPIFLGNKLNRQLTVSPYSNSNKKEKNTIKLKMLNHEIFHSYSHTKRTTITNNSSIEINNLNNQILNHNNINNSINSNNKINKFHIGSVKKNLMNTLQKENYKEEEDIDLEKMIDYIISSTKHYNKNYHFYEKENDNIALNENENKETMNNKNIENNKEMIEFNYHSCKCKKIGCSKYSCSCLRGGLKCGKFCNCKNCNNK